MRALFDYEPEEDTLLPCKEIGLSFQYGEILQVSDLILNAVSIESETKITIFISHHCRLSMSKIRIGGKPSVLVKTKELD